MMRPKLIFPFRNFNNKFSKLQVLTHGLFSTMGQISTLQLLHIIKLMTPISQFVLNSTTTRPSIFVQKKEKKYQKKEKKKNTSLFYEEEEVSPIKAFAAKEN